MALTATVSNGAKNLAKVWVPRVMISRNKTRWGEHPVKFDNDVKFREDWTKYIFPLHLPFREGPDPLGLYVLTSNFEHDFGLKNKACTFLFQ